MKIIGLTGGSGTGKGTVAARMRENGAGWVDADAVYRTLCAENRAMLDALDTAFGGVTDENGALDRPKLAKIVFADPEKLALLNRITTPYIRAASLAAIRAQSACPVVLYDAPTLFEAGADDFCDAVIAVLAPHDTRVSRIIERDHLPEEAARARIDAQPRLLPRKMRLYHRKQRRSRYSVPGYRCFISNSHEVIRIFAKGE